MLRARIAVSLLVAASAAAAQTTGSISGRIVDSQTSRPVMGAVIVATSPSLPGEEIAQTDNEGEFEIGLLPPGQYTLNVRAEAHQSFTQERLAVHAGRSVRIDLSIDPEPAVTAPVRLGMQVPVVQASSAQAGAVVSRDRGPHLRRTRRSPGRL